MSIGKKIKKRRKELNITQEELAFKSHTSVNYISRLERKNNNQTDKSLSVGKLILIANALNLEPYELLYTDSSVKTFQKNNLPYHAKLLCDRFVNVDEKNRQY